MVIWRLLTKAIDTTKPWNGLLSSLSEVHCDRLWQWHGVPTASACRRALRSRPENSYEDFKILK